MSERTLVVSATNLLARGFLVVPTDRKSRAGATVNGLYAVARSVLHVLAWKTPARALAIVDTRGREWPELLVPQLAELPGLLRALGIAVIEPLPDAPDEAHLAASYVQSAVERGDDVVIVGVDKRYAQLVTESVWWYDSNKDTRYTPEIVKKRFGVDAPRVGDWLALVGDDDQVPGVSGIGAKGATGLLDAHGTVEGALDDVASLEGRTRKALEAARAELPRHLRHARLIEPKHGGAAELGRSGAAEPRQGGAAEPKQGGAAEPKPGGAAEPKPGGAAEPKPGGAAEPKPGGVAEPKHSGAAEPKHGGAAEPKHGGVAEPKHGGVAEPKHGGAAEPKHGAPAEPEGHAPAWPEPSRGPLPMPLDACPFTPPATASLNAHLDALGFVELLQTTATAAQVSTCTTAQAFSAALEALGPGPVTLVALIDDEDPRRETLHSLGLSSGTGQAFSVTRESEAWPSVLSWLQDPRAKKSGHDLVGTMVALRREGCVLEGVVADSACLSHLSQPSGWSPHELPGLARHVLGRTLANDDEVRGVGAGRKPWRALAPERAAHTAGERADASAAITASLLPKVDASLLREYLALAETLVQMELFGIAVDTAQLDKTEVTFVAIEAELQTHIEALAGHSFNVNSSPQLGAVLFEELKLPVVSHTKTGFSTSNEALERIEHAHPIVALVLRWRRLRRLRDSWVNTLRRCIHADGRVHSRVHHARSFSGDLINSNPDLGRVPGRTAEMAEIRRAFIAPKGRLLMSVDFSQLGLYVLAHLTKDPALVEPLRARADLHRLTASAVLEKPAHLITLEERQVGKVVNFATFAGQGASSLALQLGVTAAEAKEYIARFDRRYAGVRAFQDEQLRLAKEQGFIVTLAGRRWPIGGLESLDSQVRSYAERLARRGTHEGSVADVARRALLEADRAIVKAGLSATPLVEVVDEVLFEIAQAEAAESARVCCEAMKHAFELEVPLIVGVEVGKTWADLEPLAHFKAL